MRASPATTIMVRMVRARRTLPAMDRRTDAVELLDGPLDDPAALAGNLRDLRRVNRWLGGVSLSADAIDALAAHRHEVTLIDVGTGGADIPLALLARADGAGARPVGRRHRQPARGPRRGRARHGRRCAVTDGLELHVGDGRSLPFPDRSFDVAHTSMVIHHLHPGRGGRPCCARWAGSRGSASSSTTSIARWFGWIGAWLLGHLLTRNRYTRSDAPLSVRRSYTANEMAEMLREAGLTPVRRLRGAVRPAVRHRGAADRPTGADQDGPPDPMGAEG